MPLVPGEQLGPYTVVSLLGRGGMGEVYKAHDPRLQRDVAIKTSAQRFSERFQVEARAIAALNHPNICQIYDIGSSPNVPGYIVMEYVEGKSPKGPLGVDEALKIAHQMALALADAHEKKITHRDLKPGNILVKADGTVKVLDFGLAKFGTTDTSVAIGEDSPTLTMAATQAGTILGTAHYMSPEQARGKPVDTRADIWSFGVVLYELTTGHKPFTGEDLADTLATVVKIDPDFTRVPQRVRRLVQACLQKDPQQRLQAIGDMRLLLGEDVVAPEPVIIQAKPKLPWLWPAIAALATIAAGVTTWMWRSAPPPELQSVQFPLSAPGDERFCNTYAGLSVSPDGRYLVFCAQGKNGLSLWLRPVDSMAARPLPGTNGPPNYPFWSPDSKSIVFTDTGTSKLKRVELTGGAAITLADAPSHNAAVSGLGTWNRDGVILFGGSEGIHRTSASGGGATLLTKVDSKQKESGHGFPQFLPDGKRFLYFVASGDSNVQGVYASSLDAPQQRTLIVRTDAKAVYVPPKGDAPGYLLWMQESNLVAQRFNIDRLEREGEPVSVTENIPRNPNQAARAAYWASDAGTLLYISGNGRNSINRVVWMARDGKLLGDALPEAGLNHPALSPDGTRLAIRRQDGQGVDIGVWEFERSVATRLTFEKDAEQTPVWSPDSKYIAYDSQGQGIFRKDASGAGQAELLLEPRSGGSVVLDWSRDGKFLLIRVAGSTTARDLWALPLSEAGKPAGKPFAVIATPFDQSSARFSPDGKWIAYSSNESGVSEIYIQPFVPNPGTSAGGRWQVSNSGGGDLAWRGDGKELYYETDNGDIMAAGIHEEGQGLKVDAPKLLFKSGSNAANLHSFDVSRDGQKFLIELPPGGAGTDVSYTVVTNWQSALRK